VEPTKGESRQEGGAEAFVKTKGGHGEVFFRGAEGKEIPEKKRGYSGQLVGGIPLVRSL